MERTAERPKERETGSGFPRRGLMRSRRFGIVLVLIVGALAAGFVLRRKDAAPPVSLETIGEAANARRWDEVVAQLGQWLRLHPEDGVARVMLGTILVTRERHDEASTVLEPIRDDHPAWGRAQALIGEIEVHRRNAPTAERALRAAARRDPRAVGPRQRLLYLLSLQQRTAETREVLWEIYRITRDPRTLIDLVRELFVVESDVRGLSPELEEFLKRTPHDPFLNRAWGLSLLMRGREAEALPHLETAALGLDEDPVGRFALAECRMALGDPVPDDAILGRMPTVPADAARWWVARGRLQEARGETDKALTSFRRAVETEPESREAHFRLGQALARHGDADGSRRHLDRVETIRRRGGETNHAHERLRREGFVPDPETFERLGELCRDAGLIAEARAWFELVIGLDPTRRSTQQALARLGAESRTLPIALSRPVLTDRPTAAVSPRPPASPPTRTMGPRFENVAQSAGMTFTYRSHAKEDMFLGDTMGGGVGLLDFDGDGWLDIHFVNGCPMPHDPKDPPAPNRLYRNLGNGTFEDVTAKAGVGGRGYGMGCVVGDYDNDGHDDLFVTGLGGTVLYRNRGNGTFEDVTARAGVGSSRWTTAAGFGDLDADGDLDLVVITYVTVKPGQADGCRDHAGHPIHCSPGHYPAEADHLFRNNGDGTFTDVSREAGFDDMTNGRGLGLAIADLDDDGKLDIFVANDASPDFLFRNQGDLRFEEVAVSSGVAYNGQGQATASMGVVADDLDGDGRIDLFITNFINEPNTLFRNLGGGHFMDTTLAAGLDAPSRSKTGFGDGALDVDRDGRLDLFVSNGQVDDQPWINSPMVQTPLLFLGRDGGRFDLVNENAFPYLGQAVVGRGLAAGDLNNDGKVDLVVVHRDVPAVLLRNTTEGGHWLGVRLRGSKSGRTPIGARVTCRAGGRSFVRWLTSGTGYLSAHDPRLWFGLGKAERIERLEVRWLSGREETWNDLEADQVLNLEEGRGPSNVAKSGTP